MLQIPNALTVSRLFLAPVFFWVFLSGEHGGLGDTDYGPYLAVGLALYFEASDVADGLIARRSNSVSTMGKILDPLADRISRFTVFLAFLVEGYASPWAVMIIFMRETIVTSLRVLAAGSGFIVAARWSGKLKAILQGIVINTVLIMIAFRESLGLETTATHDPVRETWAIPLVWLVAVVTAVTLVDYAKALRQYVRFSDQ